MAAAAATPETVLSHDGTGHLFDYQQELVQGARRLLEPGPGRGGTGLLALPTGGGKTRTATWALFDLVRTTGHLCVLWLAPTRELLEQAAATAEQLWRVYPATAKLRIVRCHAGGTLKWDGTPAIYYATPQMLARRDAGDLPATGVVFDEAHHAVAPTFREAFESARRGSLGVAPGLGLSATPGRVEGSEADELVRLFRSQLIVSRLLGRHPVQALQERGVLARLQFKMIPGASRGGDFALAAKAPTRPSLRALATDTQRFRAIVDLLCDLAPRARSLVFAESVAHASALGAVLRVRHVAAAVVSSRTETQARARILAQFATGEIRVVVNKTLLATGYDCPAVEHVVLTVPVGSPITFEQMIGRAARGRLVGGADEAHVWQADDHLRVHGGPQSYYRYSDPDWDLAFAELERREPPRSGIADVT